MKTPPKEVKSYTFAEVIERAKEKQKAFEALSPEEQQEAIRRRNEILAKLGTSGLSVFYVKGDKP